MTGVVWGKNFTLIGTNVSNQHIQYIQELHIIISCHFCTELGRNLQQYNKATLLELIQCDYYTKMVSLLTQEMRLVCCLVFCGDQLLLKWGSAICRLFIDFCGLKTLKGNLGVMVIFLFFMSVNHWTNSFQKNSNVTEIISTASKISSVYIRLDSKTSAADHFCCTEVFRKVVGSSHISLQSMSFLLESAPVTHTNTKVIE